MLRRYLGTSEQVIVSRTLRLVGMGEAEAESMLLDLMKGSNPSVAPYAKQAEVQLRVTASAVTSDAANALIQPVVDEIKARLGIAAFGPIDIVTGSRTYGHVLDTPKTGWSGYNFLSRWSRRVCFRCSGGIWGHRSR